MTGPNALDPGQLTVKERLSELAEILAAGLIRLHARQSTPLSADCGESLLDCAAHRSSHAADVATNGGAD